MSKKHFTELEQKHLVVNRYVLRVSDKAITYSDEFKRVFINQYLEGKTPLSIFEECGFDITILGKTRVEKCAGRWKKAYDRNGIIGLTDTRKEASGRPLKRELAPEEVIAKQEARIKLLESQLELLKKKQTRQKGGC